MNGLIGNYENYYTSVREWVKQDSNDVRSFKASSVKHPYLDRDINNIDDLTYIIYSTYMMSTGNYNQTLEQATNLKSVMATHEEYMTSNYPHNYEIYDKDQMLNDDFSYSKSLSYLVGKYLSAELRSKHAVNKMSTSWTGLLKDSVDKMANNRGLRSKGKEYFGHKGYLVIYKELWENNNIDIMDIIHSDVPLSTVYQKLNEVNVNFLKEQNRVPLTTVKMHIVDKPQRAGKREIYVMDYETKLYQQPLEKMFKVMCDFIDNEIITVPSARRAGMIHKKVFEHRSEKYTTYYLTLDCRKWAPRCNPWKYVYMVLGMKDVLPIDFLRSVVHYFLKHSDKQIHTRKEITDVFLKNEGNKKYEKYFSSNDEQGSSYFAMPYSFVMGIFNMLSSLFHAGVQILAVNTLDRECLEAENG